MKKTRLIIVFALVLGVMLSLLSGAVAFAEQAEYEVKFYADEDVLFTTVTTVNDKFTVPNGIPEKDGYTFEGWAANGSIGYYSEGTEYTAVSTTEIYAVWSSDVTVNGGLISSDDGWNPDPLLLALIIVGAVVVVVLVFVIIWCGVLKRDIRDIFKKKQAK